MMFLFPLVVFFILVTPGDPAIAREGHSKNHNDNMYGLKIRARQNRDTYKDYEKTSKHGRDLPQSTEKKSDLRNALENYFEKHKPNQRFVRSSGLSSPDFSTIPEFFLQFTNQEESIEDQYLGQNSSEDSSAFEETRKVIPILKNSFLNLTDQFLQIINKLPFVNGQIANIRDKFGNGTNPFMILIGKFPNLNFGNQKPNISGQQPNLPVQSTSPQQSNITGQIPSSSQQPGISTPQIPAITILPDSNNQQPNIPGQQPFQIIPIPPSPQQPNFSDQQPSNVQPINQLPSGTRIFESTTNLLNIPSQIPFKTGESLNKTDSIPLMGNVLNDQISSTNYQLPKANETDLNKPQELLNANVQQTNNLPSNTEKLSNLNRLKTTINEQ